MFVMRIPLLLKKSYNYLSSALLGRDPMNIYQSRLFLIASRKSLSSTYSISSLLGRSSSSSSMSMESTTSTSYPLNVWRVPSLHSSMSLSICDLYFYGTSNTAEFLFCLLIPFTSSASSYEVFLLKKLKMKPGA